MAPARVELTIELARAFGLFAQAGVSVESPVPATDAELELVHDPRYIAGVRLAGSLEPGPSVETESSHAVLAEAPGPSGQPGHGGKGAPGEAALRTSMPRPARAHNCDVLSTPVLGDPPEGRI